MLGLRPLEVLLVLDVLPLFQKALVEVRELALGKSGSRCRDGHGYLAQQRIEKGEVAAIAGRQGAASESDARAVAAWPRAGARQSSSSEPVRTETTPDSMPVEADAPRAAVVPCSPLACSAWLVRT